MRKVQLLLVCLMFSVVALAAEKVIKLPKPNLDRTGSVMKALYGLLIELTAKIRVNAQLLLL